MKKYLFLLFALFLAGCAGVMTNGNRELTIEQVQQLLGHQSVDTTLQYAMVNQNNVKISHRKFVC